MKCKRVVMLTYCVMLFFTMNGSAEYVFKTDGSIIKGAIVSDSAAALTVKDAAGAVIRIDRKEILRIIYTDLYMGKVYARLTTGEVVEGYQIDEDRDNYIFRKDINKPDEFPIPRKKVMFIARTNPTDLNGAATTESITLTWSPPFKPASRYRIYIRDVINKEEKFKAAGETDDLVFKLKDLQKSWSYELYATAVSENGDESLPSEKITVNTLPEAPSDFKIAEKSSADGKSVTLTFTWKDVKDPESRIKSYAIYETQGKEKKKKGASGGGEFVLKDFPAEGRHWFSVAAVNDLLTESDEITAVYDAGYKIYLRCMGAYIYPTGDMLELASSGYGGLFDAGVSGKYFSAGIETGYYMFKCDEDVESMMMIPLMFELGCKLPLFYSLSFRPVFKGGGSYNMMEYVIHDRVDPLITYISKKNNFNPAASAGAFLQCEIGDNFNISGVAEYLMIFEKSGRLNLINCSLGAGIIF